MKKFYFTLFLIIFCGFSLFSQTNISGKMVPSDGIKSTNSSSGKMVPSDSIKSTNATSGKMVSSDGIKKDKLVESELPAGESIINLSGRYIGRLNSSFNPTVSEGSKTWRLDEIPENEVYLNFNFIFFEYLSGLVTIGAKTTKESRTERYASKWKNLTLSFYQGHLKLDTKIGSLIVYHNEDIINFSKPIMNFSGLKLYQEYRHIYKEENESLYERDKSYFNNVNIKLYNEFEEIYNPFDNDIIRSIDINERFGKGTQGVIFQSKFLLFKNIFLVADDNTTQADSGALQTYQISGTGYLVYLDNNGNNILDINENDIVHHNFWADRLEINVANIVWGITYIGEQLYKWEQNAKLIDPFDSSFENKNNDDLLKENDLLTSGYSNTYIKSAERYARQDTFSIDANYSPFSMFNLKLEFALNSIKQRYVSRPKKSHISKYDANYPNFAIDRSVDIEIPWNNKEHIGYAYGFITTKNFNFYKMSLTAGYIFENKVFNMNIFDNPDEIGYRPISKQKIYGMFDFTLYKFNPFFKAVYQNIKREYPYGDLENSIYTKTEEKKSNILLLYGELKRKFFNNKLMPILKTQFIDYGNVSKINSQLFTPFVLRDNNEDTIAVDPDKKSYSILSGIELIYFFIPTAKIKLAYYIEHISNKIVAVEDFKKFYLEARVDF